MSNEWSFFYSNNKKSSLKYYAYTHWVGIETTTIQISFLVSLAPSGMVLRTRKICVTRHSCMETFARL